MDAHQLLSGLGLAMGLPGLAFDERGCARLVFDGKLEANFEWDADARVLQLYSVIAPLPARGREALYAMLLQGNLFGTETGGATLALDSVDQELVLCLRIDPAQVDQAAFDAIVESFVNATEHWHKRVADSADAVAEPSPQAMPPMEAFLRG